MKKVITFTIVIFCSLGLSYLIEKEICILRNAIDTNWAFKVYQSNSFPGILKNRSMRYAPTHPKFKKYNELVKLHSQIIQLDPYDNTVKEKLLKRSQIQYSNSMNNLDLFRKIIEETNEPIHKPSRPSLLINKIQTKSTDSILIEMKLINNEKHFDNSNYIDFFYKKQRVENKEINNFINDPDNISAIIDLGNYNDTLTIESN